MFDAFTNILLYMDQIF